MHPYMNACMHTHGHAYILTYARTYLRTRMLSMLYLCMQAHTHPHKPALTRTRTLKHTPGPAPAARRLHAKPKAGVARPSLSRPLAAAAAGASERPSWSWSVVDAVVGGADDAALAADGSATPFNGSPRRTAEAPPAVCAADAEALGRFDEPVRPTRPARCRVPNAEVPYRCSDYPYRCSDYPYRCSDYPYPSSRLGPAQPAASFPASEPGVGWSYAK
jgi:hypothetical protein